MNVWADSRCAWMITLPVWKRAVRGTLSPAQLTLLEGPPFRRRSRVARSSSVAHPDPGERLQDRGTDALDLDGIRLLEFLLVSKGVHVEDAFDRPSQPGLELRGRH